MTLLRSWLSAAQTRLMRAAVADGTDHRCDTWTDDDGRCLLCGPAPRLGRRHEPDAPRQVQEWIGLNMKTQPGHYYARDDDGRLIEYTPVEESPPTDVVICRRVVDFPHATPPPGARILSCAECAAPIAADPASPHQELPRICLQCAGIRPLPWTP